METTKITDAYRIEVKSPEDEGTHEIYKFKTREEFYRWCLENRSEELEILAVTCAPANDPNGEHLMLYYSPIAEPLVWDDLIGYLA